jgi:outer membrane protein OmpA-like peptidoglycan-associated protein
MPSLSANGEWLYFSSNRRGGQGGTDIWITMRSVDGGWMIPFNAGPVINTRFNEESPFLHHDGRTLYFMSEGHPGFGGQDLFVAQKDERHKWSAPVNLGYPINTSSQEGGINVAIDGGIAYMFTDRSGPDRSDPKSNVDFNIIAIELPEHLQPKPVTYLELSVSDLISGAPLSANIKIQSLPSNELYNIGQADKGGKYLICLPAGHEYLFNIEQPGYVMHSDRVMLLDENSEMSPLSKEVFLRPISNEVVSDPGSETVFKLENIFFATGSDSLMESSRFEIERLAEFLKSNPELTIEIRGHTDNVGTEEDNLSLSEARARSVYLALTNKGIPASRMKFRGFGERSPVATNDTEEGRSQNRRTEFVILTE